jgi:ribosomal protein S18 acetylase RimI-like enzyme
MKNTKFTVRRATQKDSETIVDLRLKLDTFEYRFNPNYKMLTRAELLRLTPGYIKDKNFFFFIAEVDGKPVGFSAACIKKDEHTKKKTATLDAIWVEPKYRKQGIAHALTEARLKQLAKYKLEKVGVYVRPANTPSINNVKSFGGQHTYNVYQIKLKKKR